jgi:hypothetical protein
VQNRSADKNTDATPQTQVTSLHQTPSMRGQPQLIILMAFRGGQALGPAWLEGPQRQLRPCIV